MAGTFPSTPSPVSVDVTSVKPTVVSVSESGKRQARNAGGHLWEIDVSFPVMTKDEFEPINCFAMQQDGSDGSFQYVPPDTATPRGAASVTPGTPLVSTFAAANSDNIQVKGFPNSITNIMMQGDVLKIASHSKVYKVVENADSSAVGTAQLFIKPNLVQSIIANEVITVNDVPFTVYVSATHKYRALPAKMHSYKVKMMESVE